MAKQKKDIVTWLLKSLKGGTVTDDTNDTVIREYRSVTDKELTKLFSDIYVPNTSNRFGRNFDTQNIPSMIEPVTRSLLDRRTDNDKILMLAQEIKQAASIAVPSIISPNDFSKNNLSIIIEGGNESDETKTKIINIIKEHFEKELDIHVKLSEWIEEALFTLGCKAILLMPSNFLSELKKDVTSIESLDEKINNFSCGIEASVEHLLVTRQTGKINFNEDDIIDTIFEKNVFDGILSDTKDAKSKQLHLSIRRDLKISIPKIFKDIDTKKVITFIDDPRILVSKTIESTAAIESINSKVMDKFKDSFTVSYRDNSDGIAGSKIDNVTGFRYAPYIDLSKYIPNNKIGEYPVMIELPPEAVIPIIIGGSPSVHTGYFITINENGLPLSVSNDSYTDMLSSTYGSQRINKLFNAFYGNAQLSIHEKLAMDAKFEILNAIYDGYLSNIMKTKLNDIGLKNHRIELSDSISKVMLARLLKGAETRIVFVPKSLMHYLAFKYNDDGTGRSKIEDIKFPLSLKMTFIIVRLISLIESSINRRTLNISLDDTSGNPLELLRMIKKDVLNNKLYDISYDPSTIVKSVQDKGLTIVPDKLPGVESFSLTENQNNVDYPRPDDAILEEINNMYMLSLDVPPSALNRLSEEEFSRSVASNNIFFSNKIRANQTITCNFMTDFIKSYISFSKNLQDTIKSILENTESSEESLKEESLKETAAIEKIEASSGSLKDEKSEKALSSNDRLKEVMDNVKFSLPSPNLVHDKASFDEIRDYIEIVTTILEGLYPDDMVVDPEVSNVIKVLRNTVKRNVISDHIKRNSMLSDIDFDALSDLDVNSSVEVTQKMLNLKKALEEAVKVFSANADEGGTAWG